MHHEGKKVSVAILKVIMDHFLDPDWGQDLNNASHPESEVSLLCSAPISAKKKC
jgi:hypothetical protein